MILLDTHALIWLDEGSERLGKQSLSLINQAFKSEKLFVSVISFWEVAMLVEKGRLEMQMDVDSWRQQLIAKGLQEIALTGNTAINSATLKNFHGDPADRMIVATAIHLTATLCTADNKILSWINDLLRLDARK